MYLFRNSLSHCFRSLPQLQIRLYNYYILHSYTPHFHKIPPFSHRKISSSPETEDPVEPQSETKQTKSQLQYRFKKFARILEKTGNSKSETRNKDLQLELKLLVEEIRGFEAKPKIEDGEHKENLEKAEQHKSLYSVLIDQPAVQVLQAKPEVEDIENKENLELNKQHKNLCSAFTDQPAVKVLEAKRKVEHRENKENLEKAKQHKSLYSLFAVKVRKSKMVKNREQVVISKVLSPEMEIFLYHLYKQGYFDDANFVKGRFDFDLSLFEHADHREYIKHVAERFGRNNDGLAIWLLGSDLKQVVMLGCPNVARRCVSPAKGLRWLFGIPEYTVCGKCMLKKKCKFVNKSAGKLDVELNMAKIMKLITYYALESVHPQLVVPQEVKEAVSRLLKEVIKRARTP